MHLTPFANTLCAERYEQFNIWLQGLDLDGGIERNTSRVTARRAKDDGQPKFVLVLTRGANGLREMFRSGFSIFVIIRFCLVARKYRMQS